LEQSRFAEKPSFYITVADELACEPCIQWNLPPQNPQKHVLYIIRDFGEKEGVVQIAIEFISINCGRAEYVRCAGSDSGFAIPSEAKPPSSRSLA
jgi:hypothetical protein